MLNTDSNMVGIRFYISNMLSDGVDPASLRAHSLNSSYKEIQRKISIIQRSLHFYIYLKSLLIRIVLHKWFLPWLHMRIT